MFCYLYFFSFMLYFFLQKNFFHKISNRTHLNNRSFDNKSDTIPTHWSKQCSLFKTSLNLLHINRLRQKPPRRQARICDFCKFLPLPLACLPGVQVLLQSHDAPAAGHSVPGEVNLLNLLLMAENTLKKPIGGTHLVTNK